MNHIVEERLENKSKSRILLESLKKKEQTIKFHERRINKNTIVYCKNKERLDDYERSYNNIKNW